MKELLEKTQQYLDYIKEHYDNVQKAWKFIQEKCKGQRWSFIISDNHFSTLDEMIKNHDKSKLSLSEFTSYRFKFYPTDHEKKLHDYDKNSKLKFDLAWEHHQVANDHHWQNWTLMDENDYEIKLFVVHNLVDWMAMAMKFNQEPLAYYEKEKERIKIPEWAEKLMYEIVEVCYK